MIESWGRSRFRGSARHICLRSSTVTFPILSDAALGLGTGAGEVVEANRFVGNSCNVPYVTFYSSPPSTTVIHLAIKNMPLDCWRLKFRDWLSAGIAAISRWRSERGDSASFVTESDVFVVHRRSGGPSRYVECLLPDRDSSWRPSSEQFSLPTAGPSWGRPVSGGATQQYRSL
jgi:hypothetical protein